MLKDLEDNSGSKISSLIWDSKTSKLSLTPCLFSYNSEIGHDHFFLLHFKFTGSDQTLQ